MKKVTHILWGISLALFAGAALAVSAGFVSPSEAATGLLIAEGAAAVDLKRLEAAMKDAYDAMGANLRKAQDTADQALTESKKFGGVIEAKTQDVLKAVDENRVKVQEQYLELRNQVLDVAQKIGTRPQGGSGGEQKSMYDIIAGSPEYKAAQASPSQGEMKPVIVPAAQLNPRFYNTQIVNPQPFTNDAPLTPAQRVPGVIVPAEQRLYIRDLLPQATTDQNLVEYASEASFTNNARAQGDSSPGGIEGEAFAESAMTFSLANAPVVTIGHWIPASIQVLSDARMLQGHISNRLVYGLALNEESQLLTGTGAAGTINGLNNQAAAYGRGATNDTILDTLLKATLQVSLSNYEASGFVLHPVDWFSILLLKDTQNRYLFSDPHGMTAPRVWAKPVVPSQTQTQGRFLAGAFNLGAQIWDRQDATVRISEHHANFFVQGLVAILAHKRLALTVYRSTAFVYGNTSHAG